MHSNCIKDLLNLKDVKIKKIKNLENNVEIYIELPVIEHTCPCCGYKTTKVHDYYTQPIKDIPIQFKPTKIIYRKRRYHCISCGKNFYENNDIVSKYKRRTNRLTGYVVNELRNLSSQSDIAKKLISLLQLFLKCYLIYLLLILNYLVFFVLMNLKVILEIISIR